MADTQRFECLRVMTGNADFQIRNTYNLPPKTYPNSTSVVTSIAPLILRATGHRSAWILRTRSAVSRLSSGTFSVYFTCTRRNTSTAPSFSISPITSIVRSSGPTVISRAPSAPANVPVSQPPVAATT